jgi:hypothetical protein
MSLVRRLSRRVALLEKGRLTVFGPTDDVLQRYLSRGPDRCSPERWIDLSKADRKGSGGARFVAARCHCPGEGTSGQPYSDGPVEVSMMIESATVQSIDGLSVKFLDHYGTLLINANLLFIGESIPLRKGRNEVSLLVERLHLRPGVYKVDLAMGHCSVGEIIDEVSPAFRVDVVEGSGVDLLAAPRMRGLVTCSYRFAIH